MSLPKKIAKLEKQACNPHDKNAKSKMWELTDKLLYPIKVYPGESKHLMALAEEMAAALRKIEDYTNGIPREIAETSLSKWEDYKRGG